MMIKKRHIAAVAGIMLGAPAMFMSIDAACSPVSTGFCAIWLGFQWETVLAGYAGFSGAGIAIYGIMMQIRHDSQNRITGQMHHALIAAQAMREMNAKAAMYRDELSKMATTKKAPARNDKPRYELKQGDKEQIRLACEAAQKFVIAGEKDTIEAVRKKHTENIPHEALPHIDMVLAAVNFPTSIRFTGETDAIRYGSLLHDTMRHLEKIENSTLFGAGIIEQAHAEKLDALERD
ncbi:hypothetical protein L6172_11910 [Thalassospiraceae bacterium SW-3-3]|nr:hypothetical protein L6172_11910 [Thalassospiraceae bacterium SW-3-3]